MDARGTAHPAQPQAAIRGVTLVGATGSVGSSTIDLIKRNRTGIRSKPSARIATRRGEAARSSVRFAAIADPAAYRELQDALAGSGIEAGAGEAALIEAAERPAEWVLAAIVGSAGLKSALAAAKRGATIGLANKECLVCAGDLFMRTAAAAGAQILPVDSEHNAIYQR